MGTSARETSQIYADRAPRSEDRPATSLSDSQGFPARENDNPNCDLPGPQARIIKFDVLPQPQHALIAHNLNETRRPRGRSQDERAKVHSVKIFHNVQSHAEV